MTSNHVTRKQKWAFGNIQPSSRTSLCENECALSQTTSRENKSGLLPFGDIRVSSCTSLSSQVLLMILSKMLNDAVSN
jgi:hypothetical protein